MKRALTFCASLLLTAAALAQSYTTFPNLQSGNVNFTATIRANGGACSSGQAIVSGSGTVSCVEVIPASEKGANNGVATLDAGGLVPVSQLPFSGLSYEGSWNADTNTPTLADGVGTGGDFYIANVAGTQDLGSGNITFAVGDWALYNGSIWQKVPSSAAVTSVFGRTGAVTATAGDYTATEVTNTPAGGIAATTVQAAVNELDTEKQAAASTLTSWAAITRASGFDTFTQTPSSANLRGLLTDETGTGLSYFQGGALGTPASGTLTNATGLPWSTGLTGVPTTAAGYGITGGTKLDAYAGGDTPSAFTLGIVDAVDAATWRAALGAGTSSTTGTVTSVSGSGGSTGLTLTGGPITTSGTLTLGGTLADGTLSSNVPLLNASNTFTATTNTFTNMTHGNGWAGIRLLGADQGGGVANTDLIARRTASGAVESGIYSDVGGWQFTWTDGVLTAGSIPAARVNSGTLSDLRLSSNVPLKNAANTFTANQIFDLGSGNTSQLRLGQSGVVNWDVRNVASTGNFTITNGAGNLIDAASIGSGTVFGVSANRNVTINAPGSGIGLRVDNASNEWIQQWSDGTRIAGLYTGPGGTYFGNFSDVPLSLAVNNASVAILNDGVQIGSPTGGDKGAGTLNAAGGIYQNNVAVALSTDLSALNASNLTSGTVPDARFPATLPASSGANLTTLNASNISSGTLNNSRLPSTINVATALQVGGVNACLSDGTNCGFTATKSSVPRRSSGLSNGELLSTSSGFTISTSDCSTAGTVFSVLNSSGSAITITQGGGLTLYDTSNASAGNFTLSARGMATIYCDTTSAAYISGNK